MPGIGAYLRSWGARPHVRPWALLTPILVLLIALPLLRPLLHPDEMSRDEELRLATVASLVETPRRLTVSPLALDTQDVGPGEHLLRIGRHNYSDQPPVFALLLSGPYWVIHRMGYSMLRSSVLAPYLLTLLGSTMPVAMIAGLIYRISRIFELHRRMRVLLAMGSVFGGGIFSYSTVLNPHAPAAALVLASLGCLMHLATSNRPARGGAWLALSGFCAALAGTIDPAGILFLLLWGLALFFMPWRWSTRISGIVLYGLAAAVPIAIHVALLLSITGRIVLLYPVTNQRIEPIGGALPVVPSTLTLTDRSYSKLDTPRSGQSMTTDVKNATRPGSAIDAADYDYSESPGWADRIQNVLFGFLSGLFGPHGLLSHFPILFLAPVGAYWVLVRHWPRAFKTMALLTLLGSVLVMAGYAWLDPRPADADFANRWFLIFLPVLLLWTGCWLRRRHHPAIWIIVAGLAGLSSAVTLLGATDPMPPGGYNRYSVVAAAMKFRSHRFGLAPRSAAH